MLSNFFLIANFTKQLTDLNTFPPVLSLCCKKKNNNKKTSKKHKQNKNIIPGPFERRELRLITNKNLSQEKGLFIQPKTGSR